MFESSFSIIAAEGPNGVHLAADLNEVYVGSAAFFVLVLIFLWKGLGPLKASMRNRTESIRAELEDARNARVEAEGALAESSSELPDLGQERSRIRKEAVEQAEKLKVDLVKKAHSDAAAIVEKGKADVASMRSQAMADIQHEVAEITKDTTEAVVLNDIDPQTQTDLIDSYIEKVGQLS